MTRGRGASGRFVRADSKPSLAAETTSIIRKALQMTRVGDAMYSFLGGSRSDGWENEITGLGTSRDKRIAGAFKRSARLPYPLIEHMHDGSDLVHLIVNAPAEEMTREGFDLTITGSNGDDAKVARAVTDRLEEMGIHDMIQRGIALADLQGGAVLVAGVDDRQAGDIAVQGMSQPLDLDNLQDVLWLDVYAARSEIEIDRVEHSTTSSRFGRPARYSVRTSSQSQHVSSLPWGVKIDASRAFQFNGPTTTRRTRVENEGWNTSIVEIIYDTLRSFESAFDGTSHLLADMAQATYKIKGIADMLSSDSDANLVLTRLALLDKYRSTVRAIPLDVDEAFERAGVGDMGGLAPVLDRMIQRMAAAARMPVTTLMGISPAGLNATGESDKRTWYDRLHSKQTRVMVPALNWIVHLILASKNGPTKGVLPTSWQITPRSLWQMSEAEKLEARKKQADIDAVHVSTGMATAEQLAKVRFVDGEYTQTAPAEDELVTDPLALPVPGVEGQALPSNVPEEKAVSETALNGAQVQSLVEIALQVRSGDLPRESALAIARAAFPSVPDSTMREIFDPIIPAPEDGDVPSQLDWKIDGGNIVDEHDEVVVVCNSSDHADEMLALLTTSPRWADRREDDTSREITSKVSAIIKAIDTKALGDRIVSAVGQGLVQEGKAAMAALGSTKDFDVNSKAVDAYMRQVRERAQKMGETTIDIVKRASVEAKRLGDMSPVLEALEGRLAAVDRLATDEARKMINFVRGEAARQAKVSKTWNAVMDSKTRPQHARLHGKTIGPRATFQIGSDRADGPGGFAQPENSVNCRCWLTFGPKRDDGEYLDEATGLEERAEKLTPTFAEEIQAETKRQLEAAQLASA